MYNAEFDHSKEDSAGVSQPLTSCDITRPHLSGCDVTRIVGLDSSLDELVTKFEATAKVSDDYAVRSALLIRDMRTLVMHGAAGSNITWYEWAAKLSLPPQRIQRYIRIAEADDPPAKRDEFLRQDRERAKKSRAKRRAIAPERQRLRDWITKAPLTWIVRVEKMIEAEEMVLEEKVQR